MYEAIVGYLYELYATFVAVDNQKLLVDNRLMGLMHNKHIQDNQTTDIPHKGHFIVFCENNQPLLRDE